MELTFLGTSSAVPSKYRNHPSIALKAFGEIILFDCGEGTQRQMASVKISPMKINQIFISHLHGDHILGLPGLIQSMGFRGREEPLHIFGPKGIESLKNSIFNLGYCVIEFPVIFHEVDGGIIVDEKEYVIECIKTEHNIENLSYSIYEKKKPKFLKEKAIELGVKVGPDFGKLHNGCEVKIGDKIIKPEQVLGEKRIGAKIVYSGDTKPCENMIKLAKDANILIHESTYKLEDESKALESSHSTSQQGAMIAKKAKVGKLILTHISTRYTNVDELKKEAMEIFENTEIAYDFMTLEI
ncbi:ribonuclease Z [Methanobrevibacter cuticularis]|uniref:Ribonuclease Z n=1 Tax=Methanobrevibacter cuticularis TaxID=47311 RepID=A0A166CUY3_9EURY|nr:ribonuclease Z [Methanobrevibacter cuticularis]KZX14890.1 ribonuclease Z [Methanobrevibacter cuticularis]